MFGKLLDAFFGCWHNNLSFPLTARSGSRRNAAASLTGTYVVCLDCGREFAYDWQDVHRTLDLSERYEMLCRPNNPIQVAELPEPIQSLLRRVAVPGVRFAESLTLDMRKLFTCLPTE